MQKADAQQPPWLALFSICLAAFLVPMAMAAVNLALPTIALDLHIDAVYLSWVPSAPLWGSVVLMLPVARLADLYGRRRIHLYGLALYAASSVVVAWVDQIEWLLFFRVLQGLSSSFIFATAMAMVATLAGSERRGMFLGIVSTSVYLGLTLGPVAGGWLTELLGWRSVFWLPVPGILLALVLVLRFVPTTPRTQQTNEGLSFSQRLDLTGSLIFALCTSCLFFGVSGLPDLRFAGVLFMGIVLCWVFVRHQRVAKAPLVRIDAMRQNRIFTRSLLASVCMYGASFPVLFILSLYLQYIQGLSPGEAGSIILIQALLMACVAPVAGRLSDRYEARVIATSGCGMFVLGFVVLFFAGMDSPLWQIQMGLCFLGIGFGLFSSPNNNAAMGSVDPSRLGIASAMLNLARTAGNMFSTTIMVVIFNYYFGEKVLQPEDYPQLLVVVKIAVLLGGAYALAGGYFSLTRGRMR
ncbi:MFS transporter [Aliamphritea ceti]|uniref:MFS transporter n=1 Tax=Aliamphritea ceti TaxID=1524258 RepID=UPI0021C4322D|nr:MFS transporter [Aliamphritea ceti]